MIKKERIGLLGGTFDPIHYGHLALAEQAKERAFLDSVWFLPTVQPSHKNWQPFASFADRAKMIRLTLAAYPNFYLSTIEAEHGALTYTYQTLQGIKKRRPQADLYFIAGADAYNTFRKWYKWEHLFSMATFLICTRPGVQREVDPILEEKAKDRLRWIEIDTPNISSTEVREKLAQRLPVDDMVPKAVIQFLRDKSIYKRR